jgi:hypothetical protein
MHTASRTQTILLVLILAAGVAIVAMLATGVRGGPLDPPGAPASTDGVRQAGTPISSLPFTISQPGSYYVTRDLTAGFGQNGVTISASNVTLDLNGFTLHGTSQTGDAVLITGSPSAITIENGIVRGWYNGIDAQNGSYVTISGISAIDNGGSSNDGSYGVILRKHSVLENCNVSDGETTGVLATDATVRNCIISRNGNDGLSVTNHVFAQNVGVRDNNVHNDPGTAWVDVRWQGTNAITDSALGSLTYDAISGPVAGAFARNCSSSPGTIGAFANDVGDIDNLGAC